MAIISGLLIIVMVIVWASRLGRMVGAFSKIRIGKGLKYLLMFFVDFFVLIYSSLALGKTQFGLMVALTINITITLCMEFFVKTMKKSYDKERRNS